MEHLFYDIVSSTNCNKFFYFLFYREVIYFSIKLNALISKNIWVFRIENFCEYIMFRIIENIKKISLRVTNTAEIFT